jgi:hypothetical protein
MQRIKRRVENRWELSKQPIGFMNKPNATIKNINGGSFMMVLLS